MRGGTSILQRLLESHPAIKLPEREMRAFRYADMAMWTHALAIHQSLTNTRQRFFDAPFRRQVYRYLGAIIHRSRPGELVTIDRVHAALHHALADAATRYVGDKYPDYALMYPRFIHRPDTRCIFIHRDPRDVVASVLERVHRGDWAGVAWARRYDTVDTATAYWLAIMEALGDIRQLQTNALILGYEALVRHPAPAVDAIATHLDLPTSGFDLSLLRATSVGRHRERLTEDQRRQIEHLAGPVMERWGYRPA